ncbi:MULTISPECIES: MFS transporter [unclassified Luteimonas]
MLLIAGAGVVSAFQVGKAPMALSAVQLDLGLSLAVASWLISAFAIVGAVFGAPLGLAASRLGIKRMIIGGLIIQAIGSTLGGYSHGIQLLMLSRVIEGLGFMAVQVAAPTLIFMIVAADIRKRAIAVWSTFMPVGMTVVMLSSPLLGVLQWRGFWLLNAAILAAYAVIFALTISCPQTDSSPQQSITQQLKQTLSARGPWVLAILFGAFGMFFFIVFGFLPSLLMERYGLSHNVAGVISGIAVAASAAGNILAGFLLAAGRRPSRILGVAFISLALLGFGVLAANLPWLVMAGLAIVFALLSGLIPVVITDSAPDFAPTPALVGATLGLAMQGHNVGMLAGPPIAGLLATGAGWATVAVGMAVVAGVMVVLARQSFREQGHA